MMHEEEQKGLVHDDAPLRDLASPHKRRRYLIAICTILAFVFVIATVVRVDQGRTRTSKDIEKGALDELEEGDGDPVKRVPDEDGSDATEPPTRDPKETNPELELNQPKEDADDEEAQNEELNLQHYAKKCAQHSAAKTKGTLKPGTPAYELAAADCGWGYDWANSSARTKPWRVVLFGHGWSPADLDLSGCPVRAKCPLSPQCHLVMSSDPQALATANVAVVMQHDANTQIHPLTSVGVREPVKRRYNVLHYREAQLTKVSVQAQRKFDFEMGVHYHSELINPYFPKTPSELMSSALEPYPPIPFLALKDRPNFAMSAISDCHASSQRDRYIDIIAQTVGKHRVHRYGKCGDRQMPPKPINNAAKLIATYKFYFSFENTFQTGYVTEKLFWVLSLPVLPVYYGTAAAPNITTTPSYIRATDFGSPVALAKYLLRLEANEEEYMSYHKWRKDPTLFSRDYLDTLKNKIAGPEEQMQYPRKTYRRYPRAAQCCRLCDERFVEWAAKQREEASPKPLITTLNLHEINSKLFEGSKNGGGK